MEGQATHYGPRAQTTASTAAGTQYDFLDDDGEVERHAGVGFEVLLDCRVPQLEHDVIEAPTINVLRKMINLFEAETSEDILLFWAQGWWDGGQGDDRVLSARGRLRRQEDPHRRHFHSRPSAARRSLGILVWMSLLPAWKRSTISSRRRR